VAAPIVTEDEAQEQGLLCKGVGLGQEPLDTYILIGYNSLPQ